MIFEKHIPIFPLDQYIESILYIEGNNKGVGFPKTNMSLVFNLNDSFKLFADDTFSKFDDFKRHWVAGHQTKPTYVESYGESKMIVVQFKTLGALVFFHEPLHYFLDDFVTLDCIYNQEADDTWEQLQEAITIKEKFLITENFLYRKLLAEGNNRWNVLDALDDVLTKIPNSNISEICKDHQISRKHLNHLFKENIGISPKVLSSLYRLRTTLTKLTSQKPDKLTHLAYELEYYDQAHFNNDFKKFTNMTPLEYLHKVEIEPSLKVVPHFLPFMQ